MPITDAYNYRRIDERVFTSDIPTAEQFAGLGDEGFEAVISVGDFDRICSLTKLLDEMWTAALPTTPAELAALAEVPQ